jgi:aromatic ring-opening dioxygenase catalytic subunit (LigB family)
MTQMRLPTYFISHGGGPWPYMEDRRKALHILEDSLKDIPRQIGVVPKAVLMISGHWEADQFSVMASPKPPMVYDYHGFPEHTYHVKYSAPGSPELAARVRDLIVAAGMKAKLDPQQGFDHGTFTPLVVMYPNADVPVVQLSLKSGYDPAEHLALGRALAPLRDEGVLIVGSGLSYHNLRAFGPAAREPSKAFDTWLQQTLVDSDPRAREKRLLQWETAPAARQSHPQEDHLIPLMVAVGAAEDEKASVVYHEENLFGGVTASSFRFGEAANP